MKKRGTSEINALIAVKKPKGISSHGAVGKVRYALGEKRVGHAGTLDPLASGLLIMGVGQAARLLGLITQESKDYTAFIEFGSQTTTDDAEGEVIATSVVDKSLFDEDEARLIVESLVGKHKQIPPQFSAISIDGKRAYSQARKGETLDLPARDIEIFSSKFKGIKSLDPLVWEVDFSVSKGTYIRSLARDLGLKLNTHAHLKDLKRVSAGSITLDDAYDFCELEGITKDNIESVCLDPTEVISSAYVYKMNDEELVQLLQGKRIHFNQDEYDFAVDDLICMVYDHKMYGVWTADRNTLKAKANFIDGIVGVRL